MSMEFDVLVVGAGIQGAGAAEALASAGYRVAVLEQEAIAAGTSSRSSKLIHGGLRYLESGQFSLVRECLRERKWLLANKPNLVKMVPFLIPVYSHSKRSAWVVRLGLIAYSLLAGVFNKHSRFKSLNISRWESLSCLNCDGLIAVFSYYDAQTDDAALTRDVIQSAQQYGAHIICPGSLVGAEVTENTVRVDYFADGQLNTLRCRALVNCTGPWLEDSNAKCTPSAPLPPLELVAGTHIQLPVTFGNKIFYVEAEDGRAVFVMPWKGETLVGTTERSYTGDPAEVEPTLEEKAYLLRTLKQYFPESRPLQLRDISASFAGLRVLPHTASTPFSRSRETLLCCDDEIQPKIIAVAGGKLTSYRATAHKIVHKLRPTLDDSQPVQPAGIPVSSKREQAEKARGL